LTEDVDASLDRCVACLLCSFQGLRLLQQKSELRDLLSSVKQRRDAQFTRLAQPAPPLLVKIAPDLSDEEKQDIADVVLELKLDGLVISNTTIARPPQLRSPNQLQSGGLSGAPLKHVSTDLVRDMYRRTHGQVVIVGVGGVESGIDAYAKIKAVRFSSDLFAHRTQDPANQRTTPRTLKLMYVHRCLLLCALLPAGRQLGAGVHDLRAQRTVPVALHQARSQYAAPTRRIPQCARSRRGRCTTRTASSSSSSRTSTLCATTLSTHVRNPLPKLNSTATFRQRAWIRAVRERAQTCKARENTFNVARISFEQHF
jgi:hypothetical protein